MSDWRRQGQEHYLTGRVWLHRVYRPWRDDWDHDHCEFCGTKFSIAELDQHIGYVTDDGYHWVCEDCFADFEEELNAEEQT